MKSIKHIGRLKNTGSKILVVFRTLPGESDHALVLPVSNLVAENHDSLMNLIETTQAQDAFELGEIMFIRTFSDGRKMLQACTADGLLTKLPTDQVIMTPNTKDEIPLSELNALIAEQKNCAIDDLSAFVSGAGKVEEVAQVKDLGQPNVPEYEGTPVAPMNEALSDKDIASRYREQATTMAKEAARLRKEANVLDPKVAKATPAEQTTIAKAGKTKARAKSKAKSKATVSD